MHAGTGFIYHVNGLIGQVAVIDVPAGKLHRAAQGLLGVFDAVMLLKMRLEPAQNLHRLVLCRFDDINFLEAPR